MTAPSPQFDESMLRQAIQLAMRGRGHVEPNPMVGCVIVKGDRVIGEGVHAKYGQAHAEPTALANCTEAPEGATAYVTLEPCCHTDKQTPPCAPRLIDAKIARVVVGAVDPNPDVNGKGIAMLREAGIDVTTGVCALDAQQLLAPFIARTIYRRPYVTLKWAQSRNGKVARPRGRRVQISNEHSMRLVHQLRGRCDAIAVGTNTVLNDDPLLTVRSPTVPERTPLRVVLSNTLKLPLESRLVRTARSHPVIAYASERSVASNEVHAAALRDAGVDVITLPDHCGRFSMTDVFTDLHARRVTHLLVEPGPTLTKYFYSRGHADRLWVFQSPRSIDDDEDGLATSAVPPVGYPSSGAIDVAGDTLTEYFNPSSSVFFSPAPSADLVLARRSTEPASQIPQ